MNLYEFIGTMIIGIVVVTSICYYFVRTCRKNCTKSYKLGSLHNSHKKGLILSLELLFNLDFI